MERKYSDELKIQIVNEYLTTYETYDSLAEKYNIAHSSSVRCWIKTADRLGIEAIKRPVRRNTYKPSLKIQVSEEYMYSDCSCMEIANKFKLNDHRLVIKWVKLYQEKGPGWFYDNYNRKKRMMKENKDKSGAPPGKAKNKINIDKDEYYRLKKQNELLRIENDYLKELRRLNSQEIETQKQNQKLFSTSKKNTN